MKKGEAEANNTTGAVAPTVIIGGDKKMKVKDLKDEGI